jgi:hypothetical protein
MPNFEGMTWKEMVMMEEQALEVQGVAALGARMLKTFEVVRRKMGIDDSNVLPPPLPPSSGVPPLPTIPVSAASTLSTGGGLPRRKTFFSYKSSCSTSFLLSTGDVRVHY